MAPVIDATGLVQEYPDGTRGLDEIDLRIEAGERVAVVGANGSGKSSLGLALGGLIDLSAGSVQYFGETTDPEAVRERLGVLLQDPEDYLFNTTVREDIEYGPAQLGVPDDVAADRTERLATELGLTDLLDRPPFRLSGGEKQRAAVASVLSFAPDVLLLDEPFGAVDATYRERILDLLAEHEGALIVFTPDLSMVPRIADRTVLLSDGSIVDDDDVRSVLTDRSLLESHGLRPPDVVRLFEDRLDSEAIPLTVAEARRRIQQDR